MPIYSDIPEDFYPRPSDVNAPLRSTIGIGPRGAAGHSITADVVDTDPYGYFRVQFKDAETGEVLVTTPNLDVGSRFFVCSLPFENVSEGTPCSATVSSFSTLQASSDRGAIRVGDLVFFTARTSNETFVTLDTVGIGVVNSVVDTSVAFIVTNIMSARVADGGITTDMLADLCITTAKIADGAITNAKIADNAVDEDQIAASAVTTDKIDNGAVTTAKLHDEAVTNAKLGNNSVTSTKIVNESITNEKIAPRSVTIDKLDDGALILGPSIANPSEWDISSSYEPLTIVIHEGNSFTSRQFVPIGIDIDNTDFWAETGNYNAQMELLEKLIPANQFDEINTVKNYVDSNIEDSLNDYSNTVAQLIATALSDVSNDPPLFVASTDAMTDNSRVYVLSANEHIYAFNGTAIVDTGLTYGAGDNVVKAMGIVTTANYSTVLPDANTVDRNTSYIINISNGSTSVPSNLPHTTWAGGVSELRTMAAAGSAIAVQLLLQQSFIYVRALNLSTHSSVTNWTKLASDVTPITARRQLNESNYNTYLSDANNAEGNTFYTLNFGTSSTSFPAHLPVSSPWNAGGICGLMTLTNQTNVGMAIQVFVSNESIYFRAINTSTHAEIFTWVDVKTKNYLTTNPIVKAETYASVLPSMDTVPLNSMFLLNFGANATSFPDGSPWSGTWGGKNMMELITFGAYSGTKLALQMLVDYNSIYIRVINTGNQQIISPWKLILNAETEAKQTLYVTKSQAMSGKNVYDSLTDAIYDAAVTYNGKVDKVVILDGTYDLVSEFTTKFGSLDSFSSASQFNGFSRGLIIKSFDVIGNGNNLITFNYTGSNAFIHEQLSIFTAALAADNSSDFTIEGVNLECSNIRYCVHDELGGATSSFKSSQHHYIRSCNMSIDNTDNPDFHTTQCVGGGMGSSEVVVIENCVFDTWGNDDVAAVSYHNSLSVLAKNDLTIKDNYFKKGTIKCTIYGQSQDITTVMITNNSVTATPYKGTSGTEEEHPYDNVSMYSWNNEVRE